MKWRLTAFLLALAAAPRAFGAADIHVVELRGMIHAVSASYLEDAIAKADEARAAALVIEIDTPGGGVEDTKEIVQKLYAAKTPIIGFVTPAGSRAASGGFYLLLACDIAAMSPGTNTGAAHPVMLGGENKKDDIEMQKSESDLSAFMRSIAENRGRNVKLAETAVRDSISWTDSEALKGGLIDLIAKDLPDLLRQLDRRKVRRMDRSEAVLDLKGAIVRAREMTAGERLKSFILLPTVALLLLGLGVLGIYIEFNHPGLILPGVAGVLALLLFAYAAQILPVNFFALLLILASIIFFVLEIKFVSHGLLGLCGVASFIAGSLMLFNGDIPEMRVNPLVVLPISIAISGVMFLVVVFVVRARRERVATGREGMVGEIGVAATDLHPEGKIFVHGEYWNARAVGDIPRGAQVRIRAVEEMKVLVEPAGRQA